MIRTVNFDQLIVDIPLGNRRRGSGRAHHLDWIGGDPHPVGIGVLNNTVAVYEHKKKYL